MLSILLGVYAVFLMSTIIVLNGMALTVIMLVVVYLVITPRVSICCVLLLLLIFYVIILFGCLALRLVTFC